MKMDQQLLDQVVEKSFVVRYAIGERTHEATIGMMVWDVELAGALIADRLGMKKESVLVISHRQIR